MARLTKLLFRRDTAANWSSTNPTLDSGEPGFDTTNKVLKIGDGTTAWNSLQGKGMTSNFYTFKAGIYYPNPSYVSDSTATPVKDNLYGVGFPVSTPWTFDRIGIEITTNIATAVVRLGIYSDNGQTPSSLILDAGTVDASTLGSKEITISQTLQPGLYWLVASLQVATGVQWRSRNSPYFAPPQTSMGNQNVTCWYVNGGVTGAFASTYTWATAQSINPKIYLRG